MKPESILIAGGIILIGLGLTIKLGIPLGSLPGDINIQSGNTRIWIPITTSILLSALATLVLWIYHAPS